MAVITLKLFVPLKYIFSAQCGVMQFVKWEPFFVNQVINALSMQGNLAGFNTG